MFCRTCEPKTPFGMASPINGGGFRCHICEPNPGSDRATDRCFVRDLSEPAIFGPAIACRRRTARSWASDIGTRNLPDQSVSVSETHSFYVAGGQEARRQRRHRLHRPADAG